MSDMLFTGTPINTPVTITCCGIDSPLKRGDRIRVRDGYDREGDVGWYWGRSRDDADKVVVDWGKPVGGTRATILAAAIERYPYTREERIERAIEDFEAIAFGSGGPLTKVSLRSLLFALLDAGV